jgi:hypothetical protein
MIIYHTKYSPSSRLTNKRVLKTKFFRLIKMPRCKAPENLMSKDLNKIPT